MSVDFDSREDRFDFDHMSAKVKCFIDYLIKFQLKLFIGQVMYH